MVRPRILVVDDDPSAIHVLARALSGRAALSVATDGADALRIAADVVPDLILLDAEMPAMSGFEVCAALRDDPELSQIPVIFVTSHKDESFEIAGFDAGAADFIAKPINPRLVAVRVDNQLRVKRMSDQLRQQASTDGLTGLFNRAWLDRSLEREWRRAHRSGEPLSVLLLDVDHFKLFNDRYGHPAGDRCLQAVAGVVKDACRRPADMVARYGGEEFAVALPNTGDAGAGHVAARILDDVAALGLEHAASPTAETVSVSIGLATLFPVRSQRAPLDSTAPAAGLAELVEEADRGLYRAKEEGRSRACRAHASSVVTEEAS